MDFDWKANNWKEKIGEVLFGTEKYSPKMVAIVGFICGMNQASMAQYVNPGIEDMRVTCDGFVLAQLFGDIGLNEFIGAEADLIRNWNHLLDASGMDATDRENANAAFQTRIYGRAI